MYIFYVNKLYYIEKITENRKKAVNNYYFT